MKKMDRIGFIFSVMILSTAVIVGKTADCPDAFYDFQNNISSCLYVSGSESDWFSAREDCAVQGAQLVSVTSPAVAEMSWKIVDENGLAQYWIGVNDVLIPNDYRWTNGDPLTWSLWGAYLSYVQPNDGDGTQRCTIGDLDPNMITPNTWQDKECTEAYPYICQFFPENQKSRTSKYSKLDDVNHLDNVEITAGPDSLSLLQCAGKCVSAAICDGYGFLRSSSTCFIFKFKELSSAEVASLRSTLTGSDVFIRRG